jgi:ArsR family transcriptional regulator
MELAMQAGLDLEMVRARAEEVSGLLKLLSHPNRLLVVCELADGELPVSAIEARTGVAQPNLSRDLARLRAEGIVSTRRQSKQIFYSLTDPRIIAVMRALCDAFAPAPGAANDSSKEYVS